MVRLARNSRVLSVPGICSFHSRIMLASRIRAYHLDYCLLNKVSEARCMLKLLGGPDVQIEECGNPRLT